MTEWLKNNVAVVITILTMMTGGFASYVRLQDQFQEVRTKVVSIEQNGTESTRALENKVNLLEVQNNDLAHQMKEQKIILDKIDKKVVLLLCRTDKKLCFGE